MIATSQLGICKEGEGRGGRRQRRKKTEEDWRREKAEEDWRREKAEEDWRRRKMGGGGIRKMCTGGGMRSRKRELRKQW